MTVISIIQARMGSTRLPGKVVMPIEGSPLIWHVHRRVAVASHCDGVVIATGPRERNEELVALLNSYGIPVFCGSENDVLDRYVAAARHFHATVVVRITGDCPMIDPDVVDQVISVFSGGNFDYVSNIHPPTYPDGLDVEVMTLAALERAHRAARLQSEREHVTPYIWKNSDQFRLGNVAGEKDLNHLRWIVDDMCDLEFVREVFRGLHTEKPLFAMADVLAFLEQNRDLMQINAGAIRNEGYEISLRQDRFIKS